MDIQPLKDKYLELYKSKYIDNQNFATEDEKQKVWNDCILVAETKACADLIIPEDFKDYDIFDFNGRSNKGEKILEPQEALRAKNLICKYCWGVDWTTLKNRFNDDEEKIHKYTTCNSILNRRVKNGTNVVIFGSSNKPMGRTMVASLIMSEAIKLRLKAKEGRVHNYEWVDFSMLKKEIIEDGQSREVLNYKWSEWLVIDGIEKNLQSSDKSRAFIQDKINPFFLERLKNKLPTILVFQFDIRDSTINLSKILGSGIDNIVNSSRTCKIPLSKKNK